VKEKKRREERNDGKEKIFIDGPGKWKGTRAQNENKEKEIAPDKNSLTFNY
jgi:hypothetical protein